MMFVGRCLTLMLAVSLLGNQLITSFAHAHDLHEHHAAVGDVSQETGRLSGPVRPHLHVSVCGWETMILLPGSEDGGSSHDHNDYCCCVVSLTHNMLPILNLDLAGHDAVEKCLQSLWANDFDLLTWEVPSADCCLLRIHDVDFNSAACVRMLVIRC